MHNCSLSVTSEDNSSNFFLPSAGVATIIWHQISERHILETLSSFGISTSPFSFLCPQCSIDCVAWRRHVGEANLRHSLRPFNKPLYILGEVSTMVNNISETNSCASATNKGRQPFGLPIVRCLPILLFVLISCGVFMIRFEVLPVSIHVPFPVPVPYLPISTNEHLTISSFELYVNKSSLR